MTLSLWRRRFGGWVGMHRVYEAHLPTLTLIDILKTS
jgi:hypothetical protein